MEGEDIRTNGLRVLASCLDVGRFRVSHYSQSSMLFVVEKVVSFAGEATVPRHPPTVLDADLLCA